MGELFTARNFLKSILNSIGKQDVFYQIPEEDVVDRQRFVVFRIFSLVATFVSLGAFLKMYLTLKEVGTIPYFIPLLTFVIVVNFLRIRRAKQLVNGYLVMLLAACALLHLVAYSCGGIQTGGTFFFMAVVLYSFMLLGRKGGILITGIVVIHVVYLYIISTYTNWTSFDLFSNDEQLINEDFLINILLTLLLIAALSNYLQSNRNVIIQSILKSKKILELKNSELQRSNAIMEKQNAELEKFASVASHDLRAPLRAIGSLTDMVIEDAGNQVDEETLKRLGIIKGRVERMDNLLHALLRYSKADRKTYKDSRFNPDVLIRELIFDRGLGDFAKFQFEGQFEEIETCKEKLTEIFTELLSNAVRFNEGRELCITLSAERLDDFIRFSVKDNGIGIHSDFHKKVFVIFQILQARDEKECIGAGLAIVKKLVEDQGGEVGLISEEGQGAEFWFTWKVGRALKLTDEISLPSRKNSRLHLKTA